MASDSDYGCSGKKIGGYPDSKEGSGNGYGRPAARKMKEREGSFGYTEYESDTAGSEQRVTRRGALKGY